MLATQGPLPPDAKDWSVEFKWDGVRVLACWDGRKLRLQSRNLIDITARYPELQDLGKALGRPTLLDGEIVALDEDGRPSFALLQHRMHVQGPSAALIQRVPVQYMIFDLLHRGSLSLLPLPWHQRRQLLERLTLRGTTWRVPPSCVGQGQRMLKLAGEQGLEGVVAKRLDSPYEPGRRSLWWRKTKIIGRQELVIGGWVPQRLVDPQRVGALLLGYHPHEDDSTLLYAGSVGTGFDETDHLRLSALLRRWTIDHSPFAQRLAKPGARWCAPVLVAQVEYRRWPAAGLLQQAAYKGLRDDKLAGEVVREI